MCSYQLWHTEQFTKEFLKLPKEIRRRYKKQFEKLKIDPFSIGKPLRNPYTRELKNKNYRVYYLIVEKSVLVLLADVSKKKGQQETIEQIRRLYGEFVK